VTKYHVVTSFSDKLWKSYAQHTVPSVYANLPEGVGLTVWYNGDYDPKWKEALPEAEFKDLNAVADYQYYRQKYKGVQAPEGVEEGHKFRFDHLPFWNKVCALYKEAMDLFVHGADYEYLVWIDADVLSQKKIRIKDFDRWTNDADVATLVRGKPWNTWDTGFLAIRWNALKLVEEVFDLYMSGRIFDHNEWHDAYLFTVMYKRYKEDLRLKDLNMMSSSAHPFDSSILPPYLMHLKGPRKKTLEILDPRSLNGVFTSLYTGVINERKETVGTLKENGDIVHPNGGIRSIYE